MKKKTPLTVTPQGQREACNCLFFWGGGGGGERETLGISWLLYESGCNLESLQ